MSGAPLVHLIDAHYQIFRAYHSLPDLRAPDGRPVGAVRGYAQTLIKFLREHRPTHVGAAFDFALHSFRNALHPGYKQGRTEAPPDLEPQFALCAAVTRALGIPLYQLEDYEADDVLATLVRSLRGAGERVEIALVTRDKDLGALVDAQVFLLDLKDEVRSGPDEIRARLGVPPGRVEAYLGLVGDAVDGIPGVPGIGAKTGARLLERFGSIDAIPRDADALREAGIRAPARVASALRENEALLALSRELAHMRDDLPLAATLEGLAYRGALRSELEPLLVELGAKGLLARVPLWRD